MTRKIYDYVVDSDDPTLAIIYSRDSKGVVTEEDKVPHDQVQEKMEQLRGGN